MAVTNEKPLRFVELESLHQTLEGYYEWRERARWIKLEEDIEEGSGRWSKPYIPKLSYHVLNKLKSGLLEGDILLNIQESTLEGIATRVCDLVARMGVIAEPYKDLLHATLLARHHHHNQRESNKNQGVIPKVKCVDFAQDVSEACDQDASGVADPITIQFLEDSHTPATIECSDSHASKCMSKGSEATMILVANTSYVQKSVVVFIRLKNSCVLGNLSEIFVPVRSLFLVFGTLEHKEESLDVGKTLGTLSSNEDFGYLASICQNKSDLLSGVDEYLSKASILPPGTWDNTIWNQSFSRWSDVKPQDKKMVRRETVSTSKSSQLKIQDTFSLRPPEDPLERTGKLFGGLVNDIKRKLPHFVSDFHDALNFRCLFAVICIYYSFLAPAITFAAILSEKTDGYLGISETIISTSVSGIIFGLLAGQPLIILGATGPLLLMEESIFNLANLINIDFLAWRAWIGFWTTLFCVFIVAFDLSYLVKYFTLFTEEVIAALIAGVFIQESIRHVWSLTQLFYFPALQNKKILEVASDASNNHTYNATGNSSATNHHEGIALMTLILMFGTYLSCHYVMKLRHSQYFPRQIRRFLSDFGIVLSISAFLVFDIIMQDDYTPKLNIPDGFKPTSPGKRGWMIDIFGKDKKLSVLEVCFAAVPAFLVTIILFMETELTGLIVGRKEHKLIKGSGHSLDILIVGILVGICSMFGLPWMCACPVHSFSHLNSLSILSRKNAPGTRPQVERVIEQRVTNIFMHLLIGVTVFLAPVLRIIPVAVFLGVFLYLGVTTLTHLQLTERVKLFFIPPDHHPDSRYIRKVRTKKIHIFTGLQLICLAAVLIVKQTVLAPSFPFFIILMIPIRNGLKKYFTLEELEELDSISEEHLQHDFEEYSLASI